MEVREIGDDEIIALLELNEDHFNDVKSKRISPSKLQETFVAFANSDGGDIYVGIEDKSFNGQRLDGFAEPENANEIIAHLLEATTPSIENVNWEFLRTPKNGLILHFAIPKSPKVHYTANGDCFIRVNARKDKIKGERITQLGYSKGAQPYETRPIEDVETSDIVQDLISAPT